MYTLFIQINISISYKSTTLSYVANINRPISLIWFKSKIIEKNKLFSPIHKVVHGSVLRWPYANLLLVYTTPKMQISQ